MVKVELLAKDAINIMTSNAGNRQSWKLVGFAAREGAKANSVLGELGNFSPEFMNRLMGLSNSGSLSKRISFKTADFMLDDVNKRSF